MNLQMPPNHPQLPGVLSEINRHIDFRVLLLVVSGVKNSQITVKCQTWPYLVSQGILALQAESESLRNPLTTVIWYDLMWEEKTMTGWVGGPFGPMLLPTAILRLPRMQWAARREPLLALQVLTLWQLPAKCSDDALLARRVKKKTTSYSLLYGY